MIARRPDISICIVAWNTRRLLDECLCSIRDLPDETTCEVIVVDNDSADGTVEMVREKHPAVLLLANDHNAGFAAANNQALRLGQAPFMLVLNPDIVVYPGALDALMDVMRRRPRAGAVAPRLMLPDGRVQASCRAFPTPEVVLYHVLGLNALFPRHRRFGAYRMTWWDYNDEREVAQPQASALLLRNDALDEVGLFDEEFPIFFNDVDLSRRMANAGWQTWFTPDANMLHYGGASTAQRPRLMIVESHKSFLRFYGKHYLGAIPGWQYWSTRLLLRASGWIRAVEAGIRERRRT